METNNQNLPPVLKPPNSQISPTPAPSVPPSPPKTPLPYPPFEKTGHINFTEPGFEERRSKKWIILAVALVLIIVLIKIFAFTKISHKDAQNIKVSGNQVSMTWKDMKISAQLAPKQTISFLTNGGQMDSRNTGLFGVIPMDKVKYLEQKYTDFIHCGSPGESEAKSLEFNIEIFTNTAAAEIEMSKINELVKKGNLVVFGIRGSQLQQMQQGKAGKSYQIMSPQLFFYLVDDVNIIQENYQ